MKSLFLSSSSVILVCNSITFLFLLTSLALQCSGLNINNANVKKLQEEQLSPTTSSPDFLQNDDGELAEKSETTTVVASLEDEPSSLNDPVTRNTRIDCQCGKQETIGINLNVSRKERLDSYPFIIPAEEAEVREFPWIVAITKRKWDNKYHVVCGGSLLNSRYVITAAHCIKNQPISRMELAFNVHNSSAMKDDPEVEIRKIRRFIIHPGWNQETVDNDIGLIELSTPIDFSSSRVRPICLPPINDSSLTSFDGINATVAGWGYTKPSGPNSQVLNKIAVPILSHQDCQEKTIYKDKILLSMICAGYLEGKRDACTNDSGGPLMTQDGDRTVLVGLVSWGHGCAKERAPGVYTRVSRYTDWINNQISKGDWCQS